MRWDFHGLYSLLKNKWHLFSMQTRLRKWDKVLECLEEPGGLQQLLHDWDRRLSDAIYKAILVNYISATFSGSIEILWNYIIPTTITFVGHIVKLQRFFFEKAIIYLIITAWLNVAQYGSIIVGVGISFSLILFSTKTIYYFIKFNMLKRMLISRKYHLKLEWLISQLSQLKKYSIETPLTWGLLFDRGFYLLFIYVILIGCLLLLRQGLITDVLAIGISIFMWLLSIKQLKHTYPKGRLYVALITGLLCTSLSSKEPDAALVGLKALDQTLKQGDDPLAILEIIQLNRFGSKTVFPHAHHILNKVRQLAWGHMAGRDPEVRQYATSLLECIQSLSAGSASLLRSSQADHCGTLLHSVKEPISEQLLRSSWSGCSNQQNTDQAPVWQEIREGVGEEPQQ